MAADPQFAIEAIKRARYYIEPSGSYAVNQSGSVVYNDIKTTTAEMVLTQEFLENMTMQQRLDATQPKIRSRRRCDFSLTSYLAGTGTAVSGATFATTSSNPDLLGTIMGGTKYVNGSSVLSGNNDLIIVNEDCNAVAGDAIGIIDPATSRLEVLPIKKTGSAGAVPEFKVPFSPVVGQPTYGGTTCYLTEDPSGSLQFYVQGQDHEDAWVLMGLQGGFGLSFANGELVTVNYTFEGGANWNSGSSDAITEANYFDGDPLPVIDSRVIFYPVGADVDTPGDYICVDAQAWEISPALSYVDITTPKGVNNILRKRRSRSVPVCNGTVTTYFHDTGYFLDRDNDTRYGLAIQVGSEPGNTILVKVPYVQITDVQRVDAEEKSGVQITWEALDNKGSEITSGQDEIARSAISLHFL